MISLTVFEKNTIDTLIDYKLDTLLKTVRNINKLISEMMSAIPKTPQNLFQANMSLTFGLTKKDLKGYVRSFVILDIGDQRFKAPYFHRVKSVSWYLALGILHHFLVKYTYHKNTIYEITHHAYTYVISLRKCNRSKTRESVWYSNNNRRRSIVPCVPLCSNCPYIFAFFVLDTFVTVNKRIRGRWATTVQHSVKNHSNNVKFNFSN